MADAGKTALALLLMRVEMATEPDADLDYEVARASAGKPPEGSIWTTDREYYDPITGSLDAAARWSKQTLPHSFLWMAEMYDGIVGGHARVFGAYNFYDSSVQTLGAFFSTPDDRKPLPLAIVIATLRALIAAPVSEPA